MFDFKYVLCLKSNDDLIQFLNEKRLKFFLLCGFYNGNSFWNSVYTQPLNWWIVKVKLLTGPANR